MIPLVKTTLLAMLCIAALVPSGGCNDERVDHVPSPRREIHVDVPGGTSRSRGGPARRRPPPRRAKVDVEVTPPRSE